MKYQLGAISLFLLISCNQNTEMKATETRIAKLSSDQDVLTADSMQQKFLLNPLQDIVQLASQKKSTSQTKVFAQGSESKADILIVVDNSGSMKAEQVNLASKLSPLLSSIKNTDWQIGLISTTRSESCIRKLIQSSDRNKETEFKNAVLSMGTSGSGTEMGILQTIQGLTCTSPSWVRPDSTLGVIIVSDEDDRSGEGVNDVLSLFNRLGRKAGETAVVYGLIKESSASCASGAVVGHEYLELIKATGGKSGNICDTDYSNTLKLFSEDLKSKLESKFSLGLNSGEFIVDGTVNVKVDSNEISEGYEVIDNTIVFNNPPPRGTKVEVAYELAETTELVQSIVLDKKPHGNKVRVLIDGKELNESEYTVNGFELTFMKAPEPNSNIKLEYKAAPSPKARVHVGKNAKIKEILLNGKKSRDFTYNKDTGVLEIPSDKAGIDTQLEVKYEDSKASN